MFLTIDAMFLTIGGYILVCGAIKLVLNAYILAIGAMFLAREAMILAIDGLKLFIIASFGKKCAQSSLKYYFHEGKHRGSMNKAFDKCYAELRRTGFRKYRGFNRDDFSVECWDYN